MTQLLVSVRSAAEAALALAEGVAAIDFKEPRRGALAPLELPLLHEAVELVEGRALTSAALGELASVDFDLLRGLPTSLDYAKLGLAGSRAQPDWRQQWAQALAALPCSVAPVAVIYADHQAAEAPEPDEVLLAALELGCRALLVDTFFKRGQSLTDIWSFDQIASFARSVQGRGVTLVLAGALSAQSITQLMPLQPDYVAVRGAITANDRTGALDRERLARLLGLCATGKCSADAKPLGERASA